MHNGYYNGYGGRRQPARQLSAEHLAPLDGHWLHDPAADDAPGTWPAPAPRFPLAFRTASSFRTVGAIADGYRYN